MKILVTGATGQLGSKVIETLMNLVPANNLAVSVRNPEKASTLKENGVDVRYGDFDQPETLVKAFEGIDRLLIISSEGNDDVRLRQHHNAINAAVLTKVKFIAYTSVVNAEHSTIVMAPLHRATEELIIKTGIPYSFLRNNWYTENETFIIKNVLSGSPWVTSAGSGKVGYATRQDYAEAAATVLANDEHNNTIYELSGALVSQEEYAETLGEVIDKEVPVQHVDDETYAHFLQEQGLPIHVVELFKRILKDTREGALEVPSDDFNKLIGRSATPLKKAIKDIVSELS